MKMVIKKFNKALSIFVLLAMVISSMPVFATDYEIPTLSVSSQNIYSNGTAQIKVTLDKPETISSLQFYLSYDKDKFEVNKSAVILNPALTSLNLEINIMEDIGVIRVEGENIVNSAITTPIEIITIPMTAKSTVSYTTYPLTLSKAYLSRIYVTGTQNIATSTDGISNSNKDARTVEPVLSHGSITVLRSGGSSSTHYSSPIPSPTVTPTTTAQPNAAPAVVNVEVKSVVVDGKATSTVTEAAAKQAIDQAIKTAVKEKTTSEVKINVEATTGAKTVETSIKENTMTQLKSNAVDNLTIATTTVDVTFDKKAISVISENTKNDVVLSVENVDKSTLSEQVQKKVGDKPVYDFSLVSNGKKISDFKDGSVKVTIPYVLKDGENAKDIIVYYIKDDGSLQKVTGVIYDEKLKAAVFTTNHFSKYAIAFEVNFTDVSGWSEEFIYYLAEKGIINGKADGIFAPNDNITRAEFVAILARASGVGKDQAVKDKFTDVKSSDWFAPYVTWANEKSIVAGYEDGTFAPNKQITREELCTMIIRTLTSFEKAPVKSEMTFADADTISEWAKDSIASLAKAGIVSGKGDNMFAPKDSATRAETAKIISGMYKILNSIK